MLTDIEPYVEIMQYVAKEKHEGIGNFSLFRMVMPLVEVVAKATGLTSQQLLETIDIEYPYICWSIFRDGFMHNDEFIYASAKIDGINYQIYPAIGINVDGEEQNHQFTAEYQLINPIKLFYDLLDYISKMLKAENKKIQMVSAIEYIDERNQEVKQIRDEIKSLSQLKR